MIAIHYVINDLSASQLSAKAGNMSRYKMLTSDYPLLLLGVVYIEINGYNILEEFVGTDYVLKIALQLTKVYNSIYDDKGDKTVHFFEDPVELKIIKKNNNAVIKLCLRHNTRSKTVNEYVVSLYNLRKAIENANANLLRYLKTHHYNYWNYLSEEDVFSKLKVYKNIM